MSRKLVPMFKELIPELTEVLRDIFPDDIVGEILKHYYGAPHPLFRVLFEVSYNASTGNQISTIVYCGHQIRRQYCDSCGQFVGINIPKTDHYYTTSHDCGQNEDDRWYCYNITQRDDRVLIKALVLGDTDEYPTGIVRQEYL